MKPAQNMLNDLIIVLVQEFRTCQCAIHLLQEEQRALLQGDAQQLLRQAQAVDVVLEKLLQIVNQRSNLTSSSQKKKRPGSESSLTGLSEGVQVLREEILALLRSNAALASQALERVQARQSNLVWPVQQTNFAAVFASIRDAHQALQAGNQQAIAEALNDLQALIANLQEPALFALEDPHSIERLSEQRGLPPTLRSEGLLEKIVALHHQQNAYQMVFQSGMRLQTLR